MSLGTYKVVLLGEGRVGKTSIASRFVDDKFDSGQISTVQANMYSKKRIPVEGTLDATKNGERSKGRKYVDIALWDTAGQERYHALGPIYYRNANGAVLVYDITDADTFERIRMWIKELRQVVGDNIHIVICGNKSDLEKEREVNLAMAEKFARSQGAAHFSTSAKTNEGVGEAFQCLVQKILESLGITDGGDADTAANNNGGDDENGEGGDEETVPAPRKNKGGKKTGSPTTKRGGVKIALDEDDSGAAAADEAAEEDSFPTSSAKNKQSSADKKKSKGGAKVADDDTATTTGTSASGSGGYGSYGYDDYSGGGYGGGSSSSTAAAEESTTASGKNNNTNNNRSAGGSNKAAPPARKDTAASSSSSAADKKNQPITLEEPKGKGKKGGDGKKKDCAC